MDVNSFIILGIGANVIKLFCLNFFVINYSVFHWHAFQSSLMFVGKPRSLTYSGAPESCFTWVGSGPGLPGTNAIKIRKLRT